MGASIFFIAAMIHAFRSARSCDNVGMNAWSLTYPQRKKFIGHNVKRSQGAKASVVGCDLYSTIVVPFECGVV
jgi:hypothetical protein